MWSSYSTHDKTAGWFWFGKIMCATNFPSSQCQQKWPWWKLHDVVSCGTFSLHRCIKGDDMSFSKWLPWKFYFGSTVSTTTFYVSLWNKMYMLCLYQNISVFELKWGPKVREKWYLLLSGNGTSLIAQENMGNLA